MPGETASDLDLANCDAAGSPVGNSRHVLVPCASLERERQIGTFNREKNRPTVALLPIFMVLNTIEPLSKWLFKDFIVYSCRVSKNTSNLLKETFTNVVFQLTILIKTHHGGCSSTCKRSSLYYSDAKCMRYYVTVYLAHTLYLMRVFASYELLIRTLQILSRCGLKYSHFSDMQRGGNHVKRETTSWQDRRTVFKSVVIAVVSASLFKMTAWEKKRGPGRVHVGRSSAQGARLTSCRQPLAETVGRCCVLCKYTSRSRTTGGKQPIHAVKSEHTKHLVFTQQEHLFLLTLTTVGLTLI